jgi:hypothetical protein
MLAVLSPAKTLDFESELKTGSASVPAYLSQSAKIIDRLRGFEVEELQKLQSISKNLAQLNWERNAQWDIDLHQEKGKQSVLAFKGDVYQGLEAHQWSEGDMEFASQHLRILSGLYGVLKPNDLILPYRLEMGTSLALEGVNNLYGFWKAELGNWVEAIQREKETVLNLASKEYFRALKTAGLSTDSYYDVDFKDYSKGKYKVISFFAKKARGMMANFMVQNRVTDIEDLKDFNLGGYQYSSADSSDRHLTFLRKQ